MRPSSSCITVISVDADIDIMKDIAAFFARSLEIADKAGIPRDNIVLDPGIGFGKTPEQSMTALARLDELRRFGLPLLVGASRKRFISSVMPFGAASAAGRLDRGASDRGQRRRADHPHP